ncbi:MAG: FHA domain-containing protein [Pseudanabaenaceae cyanobacterium]
MPVITVNLLHPSNLSVVQSWSFPSESVVRIGRSADNEVVLYSSVVSRYHLELHYVNNQWELHNKGANGTFWEEKPISKQKVVDGMVIRLASSGPKLQLCLDDRPPLPTPKSAKTKPQRGFTDDTTQTIGEDIQKLTGNDS